MKITIQCDYAAFEVSEVSFNGHQFSVETELLGPPRNRWEIGTGRSLDEAVRDLHEKLNREGP